MVLLCHYIIVVTLTKTHAIDFFRDESLEIIVIQGLFIYLFI